MILNFISYILKLLTIVWWPEVELNHRHTDFQSVALPTELSGHLFTGKYECKYRSILRFLKQDCCLRGDMSIRSHTNQSTPNFP